MRRFAQVFVFVRRVVLSPLFIFFLLVTINIPPYSENTQADSGVERPKISMKITKVEAFDPSLPSRTIESFEKEKLWIEMATAFLDRWTLGESVRSMEVRNEQGKRQGYRWLMKKLTDPTITYILDHSKVIEPEFGKFVKVLSASVKEIPQEKRKSKARYYLEVRGQWEKATAVARFLFENKSGEEFISGFWLLQNPEGPAIPGAPKTGYLVGKEMMNMAGYPKHARTNRWKDSKGAIYHSREGWSNHWFPVRVHVLAPPGNNESKWRVKWWYDPKTSSLSSPGQVTIVDGRRWVRYYDPPECRKHFKNGCSFSATQGDYLLSIEIPKSELIPKNLDGNKDREAKPVEKSITIFSDVISVDPSAIALDVEMNVPAPLLKQLRSVKQALIVRKKQIDRKYNWKNRSQSTAMRRLKKLLFDLHSLSEYACVDGLSYQTRPVSSNLPGDVIEIDLYAEFDLGCGCCSDDVCSGVTDKDIEFFDEFKSLEKLRIFWAKIQGSGLKSISRLKKLRELDLSQNPLKDDSLKYLADLESLETLRLNSTSLNGTGLRYLKGLPKLKQLYLEECHLSPEGWAALGTLTQLEHLSMTAFACKGKPVKEYIGHLSKLQALETIDLNGGVRWDYDPKKNHIISSRKAELVSADDLLETLGTLPRLTAISSLGNYARGEVEIDKLCCLRYPSRIQEGIDLACNLAINSKNAGDATGKLPNEILQAFQNVKNLSTRVKHDSETPEDLRKAEIGNMKSLEWLGVTLKNDTIELSIHDMPNLRSLTIYSGQSGPSDVRFNPKRELFFLGHLRLENLPHLRSITVLAPSELTVKNVATQLKPFVQDQREVKPVVSCELYGPISVEVMRPLASIEALQYLRLYPTGKSAPESIRALASCPRLRWLDIRIVDHPKTWIKGIASSCGPLRHLEFVRYRPDPPDEVTKIDVEDVAILTKLKKLEFLSLSGLKDLHGKYYEWNGDIADFERYISKRVADKSAKLHPELKAALEKSGKEEDKKLRMNLEERE